MRGDETRVVGAFERYLTATGWSVTREVDFCDVFAERGEERLYVEAKGRTTAPGLDVDTMYGQTLRRMPLDADDERVRFAVVVPADRPDEQHSGYRSAYAHCCGSPFTL